jgi:hypothetical protein
MQYQVVESKLRTNGENAGALRVERLYVATIDKKTGIGRPNDQSNSHREENFYVYTEAPPAMNSSNLYMYSIVSKDANTNVGLVLLKQKPIAVGHSKCPDYEYRAKLLYMDASSLSKNHVDRREAVHLAERYASIFDWNTFTKFKTGELFEQPLRLLNQSPTCVSIHEPLKRPTVLSVIVQDPVDSRVSVVACKLT